MSDHQGIKRDLDLEYSLHLAKLRADSEPFDAYCEWRASQGLPVTPVWQQAAPHEVSRRCLVRYIRERIAQWKHG